MARRFTQLSRMSRLRSIFRPTDIRPTFPRMHVTSSRISYWMVATSRCCRSHSFGLYLLEIYLEPTVFSHTATSIASADLYPMPTTHSLDSLDWQVGVLHCSLQTSICQPVASQDPAAHSHHVHSNIRTTELPI
ncbi:hypothetical protein QCA50_002791 [Cerrena zonata]|uniref:Uncharacterized protein n=1 Tax=Cerrena zonata TaxID=2478898 RepID=A0AAW0GIV4_9APHY